jgi:8-oxo-dGTP pyrophosphatase MutT (NUDIX family)
MQIVPAAYLYLRRGNEVLLQQRHHTGYMDGHWVAGAAGHVELHETAAACAIREAAEELGIVIAEADLVPVTVMQRTDGTDNPREQRADWFFTATVWAGTPRVVEPEKCSDLEWFDLSALPEPIPAYERFVLDALRVGSCAPFSSYGF